MKKLSALLLFSIFLSQPAMAVDSKRTKRMDRLVQELQLSDEQSESVRKIIWEQLQKKKEIMSAVHEQARPQIEALKEDTRNKLSTILNDEQLQRFEELYKDRHARHKDRHARKHGRFSGLHGHDTE